MCRNHPKSHVRRLFFKTNKNSFSKTKGNCTSNNSSTGRFFFVCVVTKEELREICGRIKNYKALVLVHPFYGRFDSNSSESGKEGDGRH